MRILLDTSRLRSGASLRGIGRYIRAVTECLANSDVSLLPVDLGHAHFPLSPNRLVSYARIKRSGGGIDVYHSPTPYETLPFVRAQLATILDMIPLEISNYRRFGIRTKMAFYLASRAPQVTTISEYSRQRIHEILGVPLDDVSVARLPVSLQPEALTCTRSTSASTDYVLGLVDFRNPDPRKRYEWYLAVADYLRPIGVRLIVAGPTAETPMYAEFRQKSNVVLAGAVSDYELSTLYQHALLLCYPSAYEGLGMPILESLSHGTPVVAFRNTAIPEALREYGWMIPDGPDPVANATPPHSPSDDGAGELASACSEILIANDHEGLDERVDWSKSLDGFSKEQFRSKLVEGYRRVAEAKS